MAVESMELWAAILAMGGAIGGAFGIGGKLLSRHFQAIQKQNTAFVSAVVEDNKLARDADLAERVETRRYEVAARQAFTECIAEHTARHIDVIRTLEASSKNRESECIEQRIEDRKMIERLAGIDPLSWKKGMPGRRKTDTEETSSDG